MRKADNFTTFTCRLSRNLRTSSSRNPQGCSGLYRDCCAINMITKANYVCKVAEIDFGKNVNVHFSIIALFILPFMFCIFHVCRVLQCGNLKKRKAGTWKGGVKN
jgi:hypothetical protein